MKQFIAIICGFFLITTVLCSCNFNIIKPTNGQNIQMYTLVPFEWFEYGCSDEIDYLIMIGLGDKEYLVKNNDSIMIEDKQLSGLYNITFVLPNDYAISQLLELNNNEFDNYLTIYDQQEIEIKIVPSVCDGMGRQQCDLSKCVWNSYKCIPNRVDEYCNNTYGPIVISLENKFVNINKQFAECLGNYNLLVSNYDQLNERLIEMSQNVTYNQQLLNETRQIVDNQAKAMNNMSVISIATSVPVVSVMLVALIISVIFNIISCNRYSKKSERPKKFEKLNELRVVN